MSARILAEVVVVAHLAFIAFAMFGALLALRWRWISLAHLPALGWAAYIELTAGICPLTPLENWLRQAAGESGYPTSFLEHYLLPLMYPPSLTPTGQASLAVGLLLLNAALYGVVLARHRAALREGSAHG